MAYEAEKWSEKTGEFLFGFVEVLMGYVGGMIATVMDFVGVNQR